MDRIKVTKIIGIIFNSTLVNKKKKLVYLLIWSKKIIKYIKSFV